jgi:hypothetical protein
MRVGATASKFRVRRIVRDPTGEKLMKTVMIQAPAEDVEYFEQLQKQGAEVEVFGVDRFEGLAEIVQVAVTLTAAITPLLVTYFKEQTARAKNRMVIIDGKKIRLNGYAAEEVEKLLNADVDR